MRQHLRRLYLSTRAGLLAPLAALRRRAGMPKDCRKILLVRIDRIGDLVLTTPFLRNLRECFPDGEIVLLGRSFARELLAGGRLVDRIWPLSDRSDLQDASDLARERFDLAIDLHYDYALRSALLARRARAVCTVGFDIAGRGALFDIPVPATERKHFIEESLDILRALGYQPKRYAPEIRLAPDTEEAARQWLARQGVQRPYATFHPGGYYPEQRWPAGRFAALADAVSALGLQPIILGSEADRQLVEEIAERMRTPPIIVCGAPLGVSASVIGHSQLFVGNNSGPLHIACALRVPSVSTMGPTDPIRFRPVSDGAFVVAARTMEEIRVEEMYAAVKRACAGAPVEE